MSSRPFIKPLPVIINGSMAGNLTSEVTILTNITKVAYEVIWTGTSPVGECTVQASNDYSENADGSVRNTGTWVELPLSGTASVTGNSDSGIIEMDSIAAYAIRLVYTRTSGTGTMNVILTAKVS